MTRTSWKYINKCKPISLVVLSNKLGIPTVFVEYPFSKTFFLHFIKCIIFMQSACHVENANSGKLVYSSHTTPSVSCRETISLYGTKFFGDQGQFLEVTIFSVSIIWGCFPYLSRPAIKTSIIFSILTSFISTHMLTGTSGIWTNTVMFSFLKNWHPTFTKTLPFLKKQSSGKVPSHIHTIVCWNEPWIFFVWKSNIGILCRMERYG